MSFESNELETVELANTPRGLDVMDRYLSYCKKPDSDQSIFNFFYERYQFYKNQHKAYDQDVITVLDNKFYEWFDTLDLDDKIRYLTQYQSPPFGVDAEENDKHNIIAAIIARTFKSRLFLFITEDIPLPLKQSIVVLLHEMHRVADDPSLAHDADRATNSYLISSVVLSYRTILNPSRENMRRLEKHTQEVSGHDRRWLKILGGVLIAISIAIATAAYVLTMTSYAAYAPFATDYLLNYYVASFITGFLCLTGGIAASYIAQASDLSLWVQGIGQCVEVQPSEDSRSKKAEMVSHQPTEDSSEVRVDNRF